VVTITYTAEVDADAATSTNEQASNKVEIYYNSNKLNIPESEDTVTVQTSSFTLVKQDESNNTLQGAEFNLQHKKSDGSWETLKVVKDSTGYHVADAQELLAKDNDNNDIATEKIIAGSVKIKGLDLDEEYQLVEVTAPNGYNKLNKEINVKAGEIGDSNAKYTSNADAQEKTGTEKLTVKAFPTQYVINGTGTTLPTTGGTGTTVFYVVGGVLVLAALVVLITRKCVHMDD
jgi:LPXTG-motif cell wall-anchored protein